MEASNNAVLAYVFRAQLAVFAARWLNAPLNRVSLRIRSSGRFLCQVLILRRVRCHLLVEKNFRGNLPFDRNFIVICLSAEVRGRLPFGTNFVVVCFLFRARGNVLLKNGLHGQLPVNFKSAPGLPSARRASSVGVYRRKGTHLYRFPSLVNGKTRAVPIEGVLAAANRTTTRNKKLEGTHRL